MATPTTSSMHAIQTSARETPPVKKQPGRGTRNSLARFIVSRVHVCIAAFCNHLKTMGSPNDARGLPFPTKLLCLLHLCITFLLNQPDHQVNSLDPGARGLAGSVATPPPYLVIPKKVGTPRSPTSP